VADWGRNFHSLYRRPDYTFLSTSIAENYTVCIWNFGLRETMWQPALAASLLLLGQASAGVISDVVGRVVKKDDTLAGSMRRFVDSVVEPMERRQSAPATAPAMNVTQWDGQTMAACTSALEMLKGKASNDAGMAVCYNLPFLDNSTGVFQADLRLFLISPPVGKFANIPSQNIMVALSYAGASVSPLNSSAIGRRSQDVSLISWPRHELYRRQSVEPTMTQAYAFVGQINKDVIGTIKDTAQLEKILVPTVTLTAMDANKQVVNTTIAEGEATFVSGVFAKAITASKTQVQPPIQTLVVAKDAPFIVPGMNILIFPIGGIITGVWAVLFIGTIGYGTFGRIQFRDQYKRRSARAEKGGMARI